MSFRTLVVGFVLLAACASGPDHAPVPYPAATIRDATAAGRTYLFRIETPGAPSQRLRMKFEVVDARGGVLLRTQWAEAEDEPPPEPARRVTWVELESHAHYPRAQTTITDDTTETPAGTFACKLYTVKTDDGATTRAWFANNLPGAPVRLEISNGETVVMRMTLIQHTPG